jgi:type II secretion system protein G
VKRRGFTLIELMVVIAIIIILAAIAIPNYLKMTERAKRSRLQSDFATLATCLETFKTDWGKYPNNNTFEAVNTAATNVHGELSGTDGAAAKAVLNIWSKTNAVGETNPAAGACIEYIKAGTLTSMVNPFSTTAGDEIKYGSKDGMNWTLYVDTKATTNPFMVRTSDTSTPVFQAAAPAAAY